MIKPICMTIPARPHPTPKHKPLTEQHRFWDAIHRIELPIVLVCQKILMAERLTNFWAICAKAGSARLLAISPSVFFALGYCAEAKHLASSLVFYAILSSFCKFTIPRRRPGSYPEAWGPVVAPTSSFPSRHTMGTTILASFLPSYIQWPYIIIMICDRIAYGQHYLTDCVVGFWVGKLAVCFGKTLENPHLCLILLTIAVKLWSGGLEILAGCVPMMVTPDFVCNPVLSPLLLILVVLEWFIRVEKKEPRFLDCLIWDIFVTSLNLYALIFANQLYILYE
jgi:hypothetical protein